MQILKSPCWMLFIALSTLCACKSDGGHERTELDEVSVNHEIALHQFKQAQVEFARRNPTPLKLEFPGEGTLILHECTLEGYPEHEEMWIRYTYLNTTGHVIDAARITITLRDPASGAEFSEETVLDLPLLLRLGPDSSITTYAHVPTRGMHLHPKWQWEIRAEAVVRTDAG